MFRAARKYMYSAVPGGTELRLALGVICQLDMEHVNKRPHDKLPYSGICLKDRPAEHKNMVSQER